MTWFHYAEGEWTSAWGFNETSGVSVSSAGGDSWTYSEDDSAYADVDVWGYIMYGNTTDGEASWDSEPDEEFDVDEENVIEYDTPPDYLFTVDEWSLETSDMDIIASGTTYFYFIGGVTCDADTTTISTEETDPWADSYAEAKVNIEVEADFDSNS